MYERGNGRMTTENEGPIGLQMRPDQTHQDVVQVLGSQCTL